MPLEPHLERGSERNDLQPRSKIVRSESNQDRPQGLPSATNVVRGPQVTIEQQVASNVTVTYSTNVAQASQQIIQLEYNMTRSVSIVGSP